MSRTFFNVVFTAEAIVVALIMLAALVFLIVKRKPLAAGGVGVLLLGHVLASLWPTLVPMLVSELDMDGYRMAGTAFNTISNIIFVLGLGLVIAEIFVKRAPRGLQGHP